MVDLFETEYSAAELLKGLPVESLLAHLTLLVGVPVSLMDNAGHILQSSVEMSQVPESKAPVKIDFEPIAWLHGNASNEVLMAGATFLSLLLQSRARYRMAAALHSEVSIADFQELQKRHQELEVSEARYRSLADQLEQRVQQQITTIESAQRHLFENERMVSVGRLAAGVAHEINNPMAFISSNLQSTRRNLLKIRKFNEEVIMTDSRLQSAWNESRLEKVMTNLFDMLNESEQGCQRITAIVKNLKGFSNVDNDEWLESRIDELLEQVSCIALCDWPADVTLTKKLDAAVALRCQPAHLSQAIYALLHNSLYAVKEQTGAKQITLETSLHAGQLLIRVHDNGEGILPEHLPKVFDPFFTTRPVGAGIGLGLTVCRDVARAHGGSLQVESVHGQGTVVSMLLPLPISRTAK